MGLGARDREWVRIGIEGLHSGVMDWLGRVSSSL